LKKDCFNTGQNFYNAGLYDSALVYFTQFNQKYPDEFRTNLWLARTNSIIDSSMTTGAAVPYFEKVLQQTANDTTVNRFKKESYLYLFGFAWNTKKDKVNANLYLDSVLAILPGDADATQFKTMINSAPAPRPQPAPKPNTATTPATKPAAPKTPAATTTPTSKPAAQPRTTGTGTKPATKPVVAKPAVTKPSSAKPAAPKKK
jgi:hypothetical protein